MIAAPPKEWFVLFWGQAPYSQWTPSLFTVEGIAFNCAEQFMMRSKARHFGDKEAEAAIMATDNAAEQKAQGRKVRGFVEAEWKRVARDYVYQGNLAKFEQNPEMAKELLATGTMTLVEAAPDDCIWGVGLSDRDPRCTDRSQWGGTNWLGEVLMRVRETLRIKAS